jgi:hypothetical protein
MFSLALMSKGDKTCGLDTTVGGLSRTMQSFRVAINAKGGYCWHVYRQSVLVIDGKNNIIDGMFIGKNNSNDGMITSTVCRAHSLEEVVLSKLIRGSALKDQKHSRDPKSSGLSEG